MKSLFLSTALVTLALSQVALAGYDSDAIPQYLKAGPQCNAFWMDGPDKMGDNGTWYAILPQDRANNSEGRWQEVTAAWATGKRLWVTSPSTVGIASSPVINDPGGMPELVPCRVPGIGASSLPNAIIYTDPDRPGQ